MADIKTEKSRVIQAQIDELNEKLDAVMAASVTPAQNIMEKILDLIGDNPDNDRTLNVIKTLIEQS